MKEHKDKSLEKVNESPVELTREGAVYVPTTDIYEREDAMVVRCDMPGVAENEIDITLDHYELTISGTQKPEQFEGYEPIVSEYETGQFRRSFRIPQLIDRDQIKARLNNGVLEVELPKKEQAKPRKIQVNNAA